MGGEGEDRAMGRVSLPGAGLQGEGEDKMVWMGGQGFIRWGSKDFYRMRAKGRYPRMGHPRKISQTLLQAPRFHAAQEGSYLHPCLFFFGPSSAPLATHARLLLQHMRMRRLPGVFRLAV